MQGVGIKHLYLHWPNSVHLQLWFKLLQVALTDLTGETI